jgi:glycosyltransferase involved in cell wall biosynthesis
MNMPESKVLFYFDSPFYSGAEMQAVRNARFLIKSGVQVTVCFRDSGNLGLKLREKLQGEFVTFHKFPSPSIKGGKFRKVLNNRLMFLLVFFWARKILGSNNASVIHVNNGGYPGAVGSRAFALASVLYSAESRLVFSVNNLAVPYVSVSRLLQLPVDWILSKSKIHWVTASRAASSRLAQVLRLREGFVHVIPNGIGPVICTCVSGSEFYGLPGGSESLVVCQIGHLEKRKGQGVLIEAVSTLLDEGRLKENWIFVLEGEGPMKHELEAQIIELGVSQYVFLVGSVSCVHHLLKRCVVLAHPSISNEDLPNVISEAMSEGIPVIASDVGGIKDQVVPSETGFIIQPGDHYALSDALFSMLSNEALRTKLGAGAFERFKGHFTESKAIEKYRLLYFN